MSLLNDNIVNESERVFDAAVDLRQRSASRLFMSTDPILLMYRCIKTTKWLKEHWLYENQWIEEKFDPILLTGVNEVLEGILRRTDHSGNVWSNDVIDTVQSTKTFYNPRTHLVCMTYFDTKDVEVDHNENITYELHGSFVEATQCQMSSVCPSSVGLHLSEPGAKQYRLEWTKGGAFILKNVTTFPKELGYWNGDKFNWLVPVKDIYLYDSPDVDPRILKLPYVYTFEEKGWVL